MSKLVNKMSEIDGQLCDGINSCIRIEDDFVEKICEMVIEAINVPYSSKSLVKSLLIKAIGEKINNHYPKNELGLLQLYEKYIYEELMDTFKDEFDLPNVEVNHEYAHHAKFTDFIEAIKNKIKEAEQKTSVNISEFNVYDKLESKLTEWGYIFSIINKNTFIDYAIIAPNGCETVSEEHKEIIREIMGNVFLEFYYDDGIQHVFIKIISTNALLLQNIMQYLGYEITYTTFIYNGIGKQSLRMKIDKSLLSDHYKILEIIGRETFRLEHKRIDNNEYIFLHPKN